MVRKWLTIDGEVLEESEWALKPIDRCFYCDVFLIAEDPFCPISQNHEHDWISLCDPVSPIASSRR